MTLKRLNISERGHLRSVLEPPGIDAGFALGFASVKCAFARGLLLGEWVSASRADKGARLAAYPKTWAGKPSNKARASGEKRTGFATLNPSDVTAADSLENSGNT